MYSVYEFIFYTSTVSELNDTSEDFVHFMKAAGFADITEFDL